MKTISLQPVAIALADLPCGHTRRELLAAIRKHGTAPEADALTAETRAQYRIRHMPWTPEAMAARGETS